MGMSGAGMVPDIFFPYKEDPAAWPGLLVSFL